MIFLDTETTGLLRPTASSLSDQPRITEVYLLKLDESLQIVDEIETLVNPTIPIPETITKITGITDEMVAGCPTFPMLYPRLCEFFLGERTVVAHNCSFDMGVFWAELARMEAEFKFPWPQEWICTVERSFHLKNKRLKLSDLHEMATGKPHVDNAHRAKDDVHAMVRCYLWLKEGGHV